MKLFGSAYSKPACVMKPNTTLSPRARYARPPSSVAAAGAPAENTTAEVATIPIARMPTRLLLPTRRNMPPLPQHTDLTTPLGRHSSAAGSRPNAAAITPLWTLDSAENGWEDSLLFELPNRAYASPKQRPKNTRRSLE